MRYGHALTRQSARCRRPGAGGSGALECWPWRPWPGCGQRSPLMRAERRRQCHRSRPNPAPSSRDRWPSGAAVLGGAAAGRARTAGPNAVPSSPSAAATKDYAWPPVEPGRRPGRSPRRPPRKSRAPRSSTAPLRRNTVPGAGPDQTGAIRQGRSDSGDQTDPDQTEPPATPGAVGSSPSSPTLSRARKFSTSNRLPFERSTIESSVDICETSSTCSLRNHCMNCSPT